MQIQAKLIFYLIALFTFQSTLFAQDTRIFSIGATAGISSTQVSGDGLGGFNKAGVVIGLFNHAKISEKYRLGFELTYINKGSRKNAKPEIGDFTAYKMKLSYVEVPVFLIYDQNKFDIEVGSSIGFLLSESEEDFDGEIPSDGRKFNDIDISLLAGLYYNLHPKWNLNIRFSNSVIPFRKHSGGISYFINHGQYNTVLQFKLNFLLIE